MNTTTRRVAALTAAVITAGILAACNGDPEPEAAEATPAAEQAVEGSEPPEVEVGYTREQPYQPGDTFLFGEWELTLGESFDVTKKAEKAAMEFWDDEEFVTRPDEGNVYIGVPITATYKGEDRGDPMYSLTWALVTADGHTYDGMELLLDGLEGGLEEVGELYPDASGKGFFYMEVPEGAIDGATWRITETFMDSMAGEVYIATE